MKYRRVIIKLSGEALAGDQTHGIIAEQALVSVAKEIARLSLTGLEIGIVIGAGNIARGASLVKSGVERITGDRMGMLGTVINALVFADALKSLGARAVVFSAVPVGDFAEPYSPAAALASFQGGSIVLFAGGTGKPFYSTDTCAALRAIETNAEAILIAKHGVKGIYDDDPRYNKKARFLPKVTFEEIIRRDLQVMDIAAVRLLLKEHIDVCVFGMDEPENISRVLNGEEIGTVVVRGC